MTISDRRAKSAAKLHEARGKLREASGRLLGDRSMEAAGRRESFEGKAKSVIANAREKTRHAVGQVRERIDR